MIAKTTALLLGKIAQDKKFIFSLMFLLFLLCLRDGVIFHPDSNSYVTQSIFRMGLYPLTIQAFLSLFKQNAFEILIAFQLLFTMTSSYILATFLQTTFKLPWQFLWLLISVFVLPIVVFKSANEILSEGLAYPLFLMTSYFLLKGMILKNSRDLYIFCLFAFLLTFTRQQYIFFYVVGVLAAMYLMTFHSSIKKNIPFLFLIALSLGSFFIAERSYHYVFNNSFSGTPFTGTQLIVRPLYISAPNTHELFYELKQRQFVQGALKNLQEMKIVDPDPNKRELNNFEINYNTMYYKVFSPLLTQIWSKEALELERKRDYSSFEVSKVIDQETISISLKLIRNSLVRFMGSYIKDVIRGYGGYSFFAFVAFTSFLCFLGLVRRKAAPLFYLSFVLSSLIHLGNLSIICIVEPPLIRYTISTSLLLLSMLLIMGYQFTCKSTSSKQN